MARRLRGPVAALVVALVGGLTACSWGGQEPGLFSTPRPTLPVSSPSSTDAVPQPTNPRLPVLADRLWITADGSGVTLRLAVHAVRRTAEATVLDWSVTPLSGPGRRPGEPVPSGTDLGLERSLAAEQDITLLDVTTGRATRPLARASRAEFNRCLCTPLFAATPELRFGQTTLLQLVFPTLPLGTFRVDVAFPNVAVVPGVPVTQVGGTPVAQAPTDLTRPASAGNPVTGAKTYTAPDAARRQETVTVNRVVATGGLTSIVWTLHAVDDQDAVEVGQGPPVASPLPDGPLVETENPASGPRLRVPGRRSSPIGVRWTTATFAGRPAYECLCSSLGLWARGLREGGGSAQLATHVGPLPRGTERVDVLFPGLSAFTDVPVTWIDDVAPAAETVEPGTDDTWTYRDDDPPRGWTTDQWPTPLPAAGQVADYVSDPSTILASLPGS